MARKRMIDPSIWLDEGMAELTPRQQLLYIGLISNADDEGRLKGSPAAIALMLPTVYSTSDRRGLEEDLQSVLEVMSKLRSYEVEGRRYLVFANYGQWQKIDRPTASVLPDPPTNDPSIDESSTSDRRVIVPNRIEKNRKEQKDISSSVDDGFDDFWLNYPRKVAKQDALKAWRRIKAPPDLRSVILASLHKHKQSQEWQKDGGQFVPHPATWLNGRRWEDEVSAPSLHELGLDFSGFGSASRRQSEEALRTS